MATTAGSDVTTLGCCENNHYEHPYEWSLKPLLKKLAFGVDYEASGQQLVPV